MNDRLINTITKEYKELPKTVEKIEHLIGLYNMKLKEYEIKKYEINKSMDLIRDSYIKKIENNSQDVIKTFSIINNLRNSFDNNTNTILNNLNANNENNCNEENKKKVIRNLRDVQNIQYLGNKVSQNGNENPKLFLENYQTEFFQYKVPISSNINFYENQEFVNKTIDIVPNYRIDLIIKYNNRKVNISLQTYIRDAKDSPKYPKFFSYIIFNVGKYGLEFIHLNEKVDNLINNVINNYNIQINSNEIEVDKFRFLCGEENELIFKVCISKTYYNGI